MKKLLFLVVLLLGFVACNNEEKENLELDTTDPMASISDIISDYGSYDVNSISSLLCGKVWALCRVVRYDETWTEVLHDYTPWDVEITVPHYRFNENGTMDDLTTYAYPNQAGNYLTWHFDAESRIVVLKFDSGYEESYHLIALGEEILVWDLVYELVGVDPFYYRDVYKVKAVE